MNDSLWEKLSAYARAEISFQQFNDWFIPFSWNAHRISDPAFRDLIGEVQLRLAEFSSGHWTEEELRKFLRQLVPVQVFSLDPYRARAGSSAGITVFPDLQFQSVGKAPAVEFV